MKIPTSILAVVFLCCAATAQKAPNMDTRAAGMGKAFVADSLMNPANLGFRGNAFAPQSEEAGNAENGVEDRNGNPAAFAFYLTAAGEYTVGGSTLETADKVNDIIDRNGGIEGFQQNFTGTPTTTQIQDILLLLDTISELEDNDDSGAYTDAQTHLDFFFQNFGMYVNVWGHAGIEPIVDLDNVALSNFSQFNAGGGNTIWNNAATTHDMTSSQESLADQIQSAAGITDAQAEELVFQAVQAGANVDDPQFRDLLLRAITATTGNGGSIVDNGSGARARSFVMGEFNLSYGQSFLDIVSVGVNFKAMQLYLYEETITLQNVEKVEDIFDDIRDGSFFDKRVRRVERFNIDLGATVRPLPGLSVGLYAKNLIPFSVRYENGDTLDFHTQFRFGASYTFADMVTLAMDADLNRIPYDTLNDYEVQTLGGGVEVAPLSTDFPVALMLRAGAFKNLAESDQDIVLTTGLGVKFWKFMLNAGGHVSWFKTVTVRSGDNDFEVFEHAGFSVNFIFDTTF